MYFINKVKYSLLTLFNKALKVYRRYTKLSLLSLEFLK